jgi:succinate dehydrogenase / fumarate reductase, membrane anchor subunit
MDRQRRCLDARRTVRRGLALRRVVSGLRAWLLQRLTALVMLALMVFALLVLAIHPPQSFWQWQALMRRPEVALAVGVFFVALLLHAWVGLRDVLMDYVHALGLRIGLLTALVVGEAAMALWLLRILLLRGA